MDKLFFFIIPLLFYPCIGQGQAGLLQIDSINKVIVIDHQNFNYEWYCGRIYDIIRIDDRLVMRRVDQYSRPYFFGQPEPTMEKESLDFSNIQTIALNMPVENPDSLLNLANSVTSRRHGFWSEKIEIENTSDTVYVSSFNYKTFAQLVNVINDDQSKSMTSIPLSLKIDSSWSRKCGKTV